MSERRGFLPYECYGLALVPLAVLPVQPVGLISPQAPAPMAEDEIVVREDSGLTQNPIACTNCRQRKRKCDRQLPNCQQCSHDPANCNYPEQSRRGIPIGFINRLEARLAETEHALHRLLQFIDEGTFDNSTPPQNIDQSKADRVKDWDNFPLESMMDLRKWHEQHIGTSPASVAHSSQQALPQHDTTWSSNRHSQVSSLSPVPAFNSSQSLVPQDEATGPAVELNPDPSTPLDTSWGRATQATEGKAKELSKNNPNLYF